MQLEKELNIIASQAMKAALELSDLPAAILRPTQDAKFGDYQVNGCMGLAKRLGKPPRELAALVATELESRDEILGATVAGPGFVNLRLEPSWLAGRLTRCAADARLGIGTVAQPETIVIDYSSPNIAKQMHVGHLRSTIIGDSLARLLRFVGHTVIADNHLGDWGTQYGLLIVGMREWGDETALEQDPLVELERVYKLARARSGEDETFADAARAELAKLQAGDEDNLRLWKHFVAATRRTLDIMYERLDVHFDEWLGESAYHDMLADVVQRLLDDGIAREDQGAICVFFSDQKGEVPKKLKKSKAPFIVRKKDGAFLYPTTDVATVLYRKEHFNADRSIYVVDQRQALHFQQLFAVSNLMGVEMQFDHVGFGTILGTNGKPLATRSGGTVLLSALLDEAEQQAGAKIEEGRKSGRLRIADKNVEAAKKTIGIGAVKYADLMQNRATDYKFDFEKMISFSGNASPYLQYQYARCRSVFLKGEIEFDGFEGAPISLEHDKERELARELARFGDVVHRAASEHLPHFIAEHLFAIAQAFSRFWTECKPILHDDETLRLSRLTLTKLTAEQLRIGLNLMGIGVLDRM